MPRIDEIDRRSDVVFIVFGFAREIKGLTKVQSLHFLIEQETDFYQSYQGDISMAFDPHPMGPFSEGIYRDLRFLIELDAITTGDWDNESIRNGGKELSNRQFFLTKKGKKIAEDLTKRLETEYATEIEELVKRYNSFSLDDLLHHVNREYPEYFESPSIPAQSTRGHIKDGNQ